MNVFELQASISLQTQQFVNAIRQAIENGNKLNDNLKKMRQPTEDEQKQLDALKNRLEMSKDATSKAADKVKELTEKFNESAKETGLTSEETKKYAKELEDAEKQLERSQKSEERVTRQLEELEHSLEETTDDVDELGDQSDKSGDKVSMFGEVLKANLASEAIKAGLNFTIEAMKQIGSAVGGFIKQSVQVGMTFDSAMSQVAATSGKSMDQLLEETATVDLAWGNFTGNLREYAKEMGKNTAYSATQAAQALNYMALAGYDTEKSMRMLPQVMNLASAGAMDLANASDMITDTQTALGLSIERTSQMVNEMATAAASSNTSVEQLGSAILTIGGTAKSLQGGMTTLSDGTTKAYDGVTELNAALGILADNGTKGAEGGTALRNVLSTMKGDKFEKSFGELGVAVYDTSGKMRALKDIFADMSNAMANYTDQERDEIIMNTFNARSLKDINALLDTSSERWDQLTAKMVEATDAGDAAQKMANTQLDNLGGSITLFNSALEAAQIAISDSLSPELTKFVKMGTEQLSDLTTVFEEQGISGVVDKLPDIFNQWVDAVTEFSSNIAEKFDFSKILTSMAKALTTIIGQIPGIITNVLPQLLNGAIEAADIIVNGIFDTIETLFTADNMTGFFTSILDIIGKLGDFIGKNVGGLIDAAVAIVDALTESFYSPEVVSKIFETASSLVRSLVDGLTGGDNLQKLLDSVLGIVLKMQEVFTEPDALSAITEAASVIVLELGKGLMQALPQIASSTATFCKNVVDYITNYDWEETGIALIEGFVNGFNSMDWSFLDDVEQKWVDFWNGVASYWSEKWGTISSFLGESSVSVSNWVSDVVSFINDIPANVDSFIEGVTTSVDDFFTGIVESAALWFGNLMIDFGEFMAGYGQYLANGIAEMTSGWTGFWESIGAKLAESVENLKSKWDQFWTDLGSKASDKIAEIVGFFQDIPNKLQEMAQNAWTWGSDMLQNFISGIRSKLPDLSNIVSSGIAGKISNFLAHSHPKEGPLAKDYTWMPDMMNLFADGIRANAGKVEDEITSLAESMRPDLDYTATVSAGYGSVSSYSAYTGTAGAGVSPSLETIVSLLNGILEATQQGHYVSVTDIDTSLGRLQAAEIRRGI